MLRNGVAIEAFGTGQRLRGRRHRADRPTLIVCDDLENDDHMLSAARRQRSSSWFHGTLMKAGTVGTNVIHLATALHRDALAVQLCRTPGWRSKVFKAIQRWPANMPLWHRWEEIYTDLGVIDGFVAMEGNGPVGGTPVDARVALASLDSLALDALTTKLMGFDPSKIMYLTSLAEAGKGQGDLSKVTVLGTPAEECQFHFKPHERLIEPYGLG